MDTYPYTDAWKATVDKSGEEWRAYCEALHLLKRYLTVEKQEGHRIAVRDYKATLALIECHGRQARVDKLKQDFLLIGLHEAETLWATMP